MRSKKVLLTIPVALVEEIDQVAATEVRNRSDLVREALRRYVDNHKKARLHNTQTAPHIKLVPLREAQNYFGDQSSEQANYRHP